MATEKQIAANRANAKRSTGPRTAAGKQKSSQNALRHGLFQMQATTPSFAAAANGIAAALATEDSAQDRLVAAKEFACAQVQLSRIYAVRAEQWAKLDLSAGLDTVTKGLKRLASLDRYERYEIAKGRRAAKKLSNG